MPIRIDYYLEKSIKHEIMDCVNCIDIVLILVLKSLLYIWVYRELFEGILSLL